MAEPECHLGYGDLPYGGDGYGPGEYVGVQPRDVLLYYPATDGSVNLGALMTYLPAAGFDHRVVRRIRDLTPLGEKFFATIKKLAPAAVYSSFHKLWILNSNGTFTLKAASVALEAGSDPNGWISLAPVLTGAPLPVGAYVNTQGGDGPGAFGPGPVALGDLYPGAAAAVWVRRTIAVENEDEVPYAPRFVVGGTTETVGQHCQFEEEGD